jgi:hypothetical protein
MHAGDCHAGDSLAIEIWAFPSRLQAVWACQLDHLGCGLVWASPEGGAAGGGGRAHLLLVLLLQPLPQCGWRGVGGCHSCPACPCCPPARRRASSCGRLTAAHPAATRRWRTRCAAVLCCAGVSEGLYGAPVMESAPIVSAQNPNHNALPLPLQRERRRQRRQQNRELRERVSGRGFGWQWDQVRAAVCSRLACA